jgi:hypothetical protein
MSASWQPMESSPGPFFVPLKASELLAHRNSTVATTTASATGGTTYVGAIQVAHSYSPEPPHNPDPGLGPIDPLTGAVLVVMLGGVAVKCPNPFRFSRALDSE